MNNFNFEHLAKINPYPTQIRARTQSIISVLRSVFPETDSLNPLTYHMHNSQNTTLKFIKFKHKLVKIVLYNFNSEHFLQIILFYHKIIRARQHRPNWTVCTKIPISQVL